MKRLCPEPAVAVTALLVLAGAAAALAGPSAGSLAFETLSDRRLPDDLLRPRDVRWAGDESVYLASMRGNVVELSLEADDGLRTIVAAPARRSWDLNAERLGLGPRHLVVGSMAFTLRWKERGAADFAGEYHLEYIADLDLFEDRLLAAGIRRDDEGQLGADGTIAWLGRLGEPWTEFQEILPSRSGPGVATMESCAAMEVTAVRFLPDGSFVIVPGADPGIFLYGPDGKLRRTWDGDPLRVGDPCDMPRKASLVYSAEPYARSRWIDARRLVEDILPLPSGPAVVVRERVGDEIVWDLALLRDDGSVETVRLPVTSSVVETRLRGDVRGDRLALLLATWMAPRDGRPAEHRLVVLRVGSSTASNTASSDGAGP